jgi:N-acetylneuraminate synthase
MINVIGEVGINYAFGNNKDKFISNAQKLISLASVAGCNYVKFQKRNPDIAVPDAQKTKPKKVPWRKEETTYLQYKEDIEFSFEQYQYIVHFCQENEIDSFVSVWDIDSAQEMSKLYTLTKIPSAKLTDWELLETVRDLYDVKILSTGMSFEEEIDKAVDILQPQIIMHTNSVYPTPIEDLYLKYIKWLKEKYPKKEIGYSSHYYGIKDVFPAVALDIQWIEKHITLNHENWGSDQKASVEPHGLFELVKGIRDIELGLAKGYEKRTLYPGEEIKRESLRGK